MVKILGVQQKSYRILTSWVKTELPQIESKTQVWEAFLGHTQYPQETARNALLFGTCPRLFIYDLKGSYGQFDESLPDTINLGKKLVNDFEQDSTNVNKQKLIEATILHELVHWALFRQGKCEPQEMGVAFEKAAYGNCVLKPGDLIHAPKEELGILSRRYESRGNPAAIGRDKNGGWSYGLYQLASNKRRIRDFIDFLKTRMAYQTFADELEAAGGDAQARAGTPSFQAAWKELATDPAFSTAQHDYIKATHYDVFVNTLSRHHGFDIATRSKVLRDVAWSVSVQHGPRSVHIFTRALNTLSPALQASDRALINAIYDERSKVDIYFTSSTVREKKAVQNRFDAERKNALQTLVA